MSNTIVNYWKYNDGWTMIPHVLQAHYGKDREYNDFIKGWHCWVYPENDLEFVKWMKDNMKGHYDATWRFNSGDPMYTVYIREDEDASLFKLKWL